MANIEYPVKQVIIANMEMPWNQGRIAAHVAHASVASLLDKGSWDGEKFTIDTSGNPALKFWLQDSFTKIVYKVWGRSAIEDQMAKAKELKLQTSLIEEDGYATALAIEPAELSRIKVFKDLTLL